MNIRHNQLVVAINARRDQVTMIFFPHNPLIGLNYQGMTQSQIETALKDFHFDFLHFSSHTPPPFPFDAHGVGDTRLMYFERRKKSKE